MTTISRVSENRKIDLPPLEALVWAAVLQLPSEQGLLLRALLTKDHDFQHPKRGHVVRDLARHMKVTDRTIRNWIDEALANPILHKAALGALPEIGVELAGLDQSPERGGRSVRTWTSADSGKAGGSNADKMPQRSKHDRSRGNWAWSAREDKACRDGVPLVPWSGRNGHGEGYTGPNERRGGVGYCREAMPLLWLPVVAYRRKPEPERGECLPCRQGAAPVTWQPGTDKPQTWGYAWYKRRGQRNKGDGRQVLTRRREVIAPLERAKVWRLIVEPVSRIEYSGMYYWRPGSFSPPAVKIFPRTFLSPDWQIPTLQARTYGRRRLKRAADYAWLGRGQRVHLWWARAKLIEAKQHGNGGRKHA